MPLQADPTVQYAVGQGAAGAPRADLQIDHPYNTYRRTACRRAPSRAPASRAIEAARRSGAGEVSILRRHRRPPSPLLDHGRRAQRRGAALPAVAPVGVTDLGRARRLRALAGCAKRRGRGARPSAAGAWRGGSPLRAVLARQPGRVTSWRDRYRALKARRARRRPVRAEEALAQAPDRSPEHRYLALSALRRGDDATADAHLAHHLALGPPPRLAAARPRPPRAGGRSDAEGERVRGRSLEDE